MRDDWEITADWESLDSGEPGERACFAALGIRAHGNWLTEGRDAIANRLRVAPYLSAYHMAEWLAWNWWRLRWEPRAATEEWAYAHRMADIGGGYIWPNITVFSDGERTAFIAQATTERPSTPFRYISNTAVVIPSEAFEAGVDEFLERVLERLDAQSVTESNLSRIWNDVRLERNDPDIAVRRKFEALLGRDPDEADASMLDALLDDATRLGRAATEELAAETGRRVEWKSPLTASGLDAVAATHGRDASRRDMVQLVVTRRPDARTPAWKVGEATALALRQQIGFGAELLEDTKLAELMGTTPDVLQPGEHVETDISFALDRSEGDSSRIVLRPTSNSGRRFALTRLLADRLLTMHDGTLSPATNAYTYRQKMQRAFAAEFLSPFEAVREMLNGDYAPDSLSAVADHFKVSEMTIRTQLVNHGLLGRDELDTEALAQAA